MLLALLTNTASPMDRATPRCPPTQPLSRRASLRMKKRMLRASTMASAEVEGAQASLDDGKRSLGQLPPVRRDAVREGADDVPAAPVALVDEALQVARRAFELVADLRCLVHDLDHRQDHQAGADDHHEHGAEQRRQPALHADTLEPVHEGRQHGAEQARDDERDHDRPRGAHEPGHHHDGDDDADGEPAGEPQLAEPHRDLPVLLDLRRVVGVAHSRSWSGRCRVFRRPA